jgi:hypothetical protein
MAGMHRLQFEVRDEDITPLRQLAFKENRSVRDQGSWLLHLKIQEELAKLDDDAEVAEVA